MRRLLCIYLFIAMIFFLIIYVAAVSLEALSVIIAAISVFFAANASFWNSLSIRKKILIEWLSKIESDLQAYDINFLDHFRLSANHIANNPKLKIIKNAKINNKNEEGKLRQILLLVAEESISYAKRELPESFKEYKIAQYNIRWDYPMSYCFFDKIRNMLSVHIEVVLNSKVLKDLMFSIYQEMSSNSNLTELEYFARFYNRIMEEHSKILEKVNRKKFSLIIAEMYYLYLNHIYNGDPYKFWQISRYEKKLYRKHNLDERTEFKIEELLKIQKKFFKQIDFKKMSLLWNQARNLMKL